MVQGVDARLAVAGALAAALVLGGCGGPSQDEKDRAVAGARVAFAAARARGVELERGPCIAERLPDLPGWVADVAHDPRRQVDDEPANQCRRFREGEAEHFVELSPQGKLIRAE